jgi:hypothetical protein
VYEGMYQLFTITKKLNYPIRRSIQGVETENMLILCIRFGNTSVLYLINTA